MNLLQQNNRASSAHKEGRQMGQQGSRADQAGVPGN